MCLNCYFEEIDCPDEGWQEDEEADDDDDSITLVQPPHLRRVGRRGVRGR